MSLCYPIMKPRKVLTEACAMGTLLLIMVILFPRFTLGTLGAMLFMLFRELNKS